ncbi:MAG TPA: hypothetical protein VGP46_03220, partial [Acidimicrobiales bacterium]|nr:hypothetical protein [Acidimicrobiales bacterium]
VDVPAGASVVTFAYQPPGWAASQLLALGGVLVLVVLAGLDIAYRRRRRPAQGSPRRSRSGGPGRI